MQTSYFKKDSVLSSNLGVYRRLVRYYNSEDVCINKEYETLNTIVSTLTTLIRRIEKKYHKTPGMQFVQNVVAIIKEGIPRGFTEFGILVNTGEKELVYRLINYYGDSIDLTYDIPSKYVVLHQQELKVNDKIAVELPIIIAFRNRHIDLMGLIAHSSKETRFELIKEFQEPLLSDKHFKDLKIYDFVEEHYPEREIALLSRAERSYYPSSHQPYCVYGGKTVVEKTLTLAYKIGYIDLIKYFLSLESERKICDVFVWRKLVFHSLVEDEILLFCHFVQVGLYIDNFHLKYIVKRKETKIGSQRNTLLDLVYLSGAPITLDQLLFLSNDEENNILEFYFCNPLTLVNYCRIFLRKHFRHILPDNSSIYKILHELDLPNTLVSFLKMEDFIHKHLYM